MVEKRNRVMGLFPTPLMHAQTVIGGALLQEVQARIEAEHRERNTHTGLLSHTAMVSASEDALFARVAAEARPAVLEFGELLFGERLDWAIKEIWVNVLETGGHQALHNHANSFISGVIYLTEHHPRTGTVFHKQLGGSDYSFVNQNRGVKNGPFNASKWQSPPMKPGDMVLFPSYLLHEVPKNEGGRRITMAFNALPDRLDSWGYTVRFG